MPNNEQLTRQLKNLKLSGMAETLDGRLRQAEERQLAHSELLMLLIDDETETRRNRKLLRLITSARLPANQTLESFDFRFNPSINPVTVRELATLRFIEKSENIFFIGPTGVGKTHLARAIAHLTCRKYLSVQFLNFTSLLTDINKADITGRQEVFLKPLIKCDLLVIDDFAFKKMSPAAAEYFYTVVDQRYQQKSTLLTSNRPMNDWMNIFPDPVMANAVLDRLAHNAHQIIITGESYRKKNGLKN